MRLVLVVLLILAMPEAAVAERRVALVIGNDSYENVPDLLKAVNDARAVENALGRQGFDVLSAIDADRRTMNRRISQFTANLEPGDTALVFFAGHGVGIDGENYLLPTDVVVPETGDPDFVASESIALSRLLDRVRRTGARTTLAIIDACRENPFGSQTGRSIGGARGLGRIAAPEGTFVLFSAGAGQLALDRLSDDDPDPNSVFTRALLPRLSESGLELRDLVREVRLDVRDLALERSHAQFPAYYDELLGAFYFADSRGPQSAPAEPADSGLRADFDLAREIGTAAALDAFLSEYKGSDDFTISLARELLSNLAATGTERVAALAPERPDRDPDPRETIRATQRALNELGCEAGGADGIAGPRTRRAFERALREIGLPLSLDDLGSAAALAALQAAGAKYETAGGTTIAGALPGASGLAGVNLSGTWRGTSSCPLFVTTNWTMRLDRSGSGTYAMVFTDSLGQTGRGTMRGNGNSLSGSLDWGHIRTTSTATVSADGTTISGRDSVGCTFSGRRE